MPPHVKSREAPTLNGLKFRTNAASPEPVAIGHFRSAADRALFDDAAKAAVAATATTTERPRASTAILVR